MALRTMYLSSPTGRVCTKKHTSNRLKSMTIVASGHAQRHNNVNDLNGLSQQTISHDALRSLNRRSLLLASGAVIGLAPWLPALSLEDSSAVQAPSAYTDPQDGFTLSVPPGWVFGEGELPGNSSFTGASGARRTLVWFPEGANPRDVNVTLVITNVSVEFTRLGSFGTPYQFGSTLVNSQDRSYLLRAPQWARGKDPVQIAKLVDASEISNRYFVEYTVQKLPEPQRHLYSLLALGYNGMYNRLYTITAQTLEEDRSQFEATLLAMVKSLSVPPQRF
ncbi:hypothetical protein Vretimale_7369 [Volvox reticuliferus]|uniref:PsbP C-terminal domain-containing protein n=1 Tax=Volvox reticuliferus TaxID=1737510 RepID=A0A8J4FKL5_9CHLO|nr:hypothetical protein Vretifemale_7477 [Volvox reticuliferus]GIM02549.1 hypothetical protein Vretimale_7369 [Volvox reticuliferus]